MAETSSPSSSRTPRLDAMRDHPASKSHSATTSGPAVVAEAAIASFVAHRPRTASRVEALSSVHDAPIPAGESSTAAVLRQKLAQLSLQQSQEHCEEGSHSPYQPSISIIHTGKQREDNTTSPPASPSNHHLASSASTSKSHKNGVIPTAEVRQQKSLYRLSRGRSDHVSPSRLWDRRGASATVLSGNSGSGSGGEDSEITLRPGRRESRSQHQSSHRQSPTRHRWIPLVGSGNSPPAGTTAATTPSPSLSRKSSFKRHNSPLARWVDNKPSSVAFDALQGFADPGDDRNATRHGVGQDDDIRGHITSSDEEGADASKYARRRRVSLERDRRRGMRILLASGGGNGSDSSATVAKHERQRRASASSGFRRGRRTSSERSRGLSSIDVDLRLTPTSEAGSTFPSTSTSATPTTIGDDHSERSSLLSRSSSSDAFDSVPNLVASTATVGRRTRMPSAGENAEASIFGLADDEHDHDTSAATAPSGLTIHVEGEEDDDGAVATADLEESLRVQDAMPTSGALSSRALAAALTQRSPRCSDSTVKSAKIRSMPASRRPSHPETSMPGASASSVPHRASAILGFAPAAPTASGPRFGTLPRARPPTSQVPNRHAWLSLSPKSHGPADVAPVLDLLSGTSIGSVEDLILVDQVEWASDREETAQKKAGDSAILARRAAAIDSRRSSMISVRQGEREQVECTGPPTVAAIEAGSLLGVAGSQSSADQMAGGAPAVDPALPPPSPTGSGAGIFSKQEVAQLPVNGRQGFAAVYQDRISNLQSQLRLWSRDREQRTLSPDGHSESSETDSRSRDHIAAQGDEAQSHSAGLLASSWKQIARLPNLFFHHGSSQEEAVSSKHAHSETLQRSTSTDSTSEASGIVPRITRSSSHDADVSSLTDTHGGLPSPSSSPDSSGFNLRSASDSEGLSDARHTQMSDGAAASSHRQRSHGRNPSLGSRGVVSPQDGDVDPGAYVTGLGHRIDPDVELASVVHMHASRAQRGRSVDHARRSSSTHGEVSNRLHRPLAPSRVGSSAERVTASDGESVPSKAGFKELLSKSDVDKVDAKSADLVSPPPIVLPTQVVNAMDGRDAVGNDTALVSPPRSSDRRTRARARFTLHGDRDDGRDEDDEDSATTVGKAKDTLPHQRDATASATPAVAPRDAGNAEGPDADGFTTVRRHQNRGRPGVSRPAAEAPVPTNFSAYADMSSSASSDDDQVVDRPVLPNRRSRSRPRGTSRDDARTGLVAPAMSRSMSDSRSQSGQEEEREDGDGRNGSTRGRRGRDRGRGSRNASPTASATRHRQCAIGLFSASNKTSRRQGGDAIVDPIAAATRSSLGVRSVRSSPNLSYAKVAAAPRSDGRANGVQAAPHRSEANSEESSDDDRSRRGRERGVVKVTSSSFKESECPPNSLPRSASAGDFRSLSFSLSSPQAAASQSQAQARKQRLLASQQGQVPEAPGSKAGLVLNGASSDATPGSSDSCSVSETPGSFGPNASASGAPGSLISMPNRPTLLSNSAHLLMLSLELEMMRAQKISAPLRIRWARQRTTSVASTVLPAATATPTAEATPTSTDPDVCVTSGSDASAVTSPPSTISATSTPSLCGSRDSATGGPVSPSLPSTMHWYGRGYRPRTSSQLRNVVNG